MHAAAMAFLPPTVLRAASTTQHHDARCTKRWRLCATSDVGGSAEWLESPGSVARAWQGARRAANRMDLERRHVGVLFVSNHCERALLAERAFILEAERRSRSRRLLIHSAGLYCAAGASLPHALLTFAEQRGLCVPESQPCARFDITDFDFYDFVLPIDQNIQDRISAIAVHSARTKGTQLAEWERKIKLFADFDGHACSTAAHLLEIPAFSEHTDKHTIMIRIQNACVRILDELIVCGL